MLWWLSFADPDLPEGTQLLGVSVVEGSNFLSAVTQAGLLGCNPGGECAGVPFTGEMADVPRPDEIGVLLTKEQAAALDERLGEALRKSRDAAWKGTD